jgi:hypothetical protein
MSIESTSKIADDQDPGHAGPGEKPNDRAAKSPPDVFEDLARVSPGEAVRATELTQIPVRKPAPAMPNGRYPPFRSKLSKLLRRSLFRNRFRVSRTIQMAATPLHNRNLRTKLARLSCF